MTQVSVSDPGDTFLRLLCVVDVARTCVDCVCEGIWLKLLIYMSTTWVLGLDNNHLINGEGLKIIIYIQFWQQNVFFNKKKKWL